MTCRHCNMPLDTQFGCTCYPNKSIPTPKIVYVNEEFDSDDVTDFERNLTWFLSGVLVTLITFGVFYS